MADGESARHLIATSGWGTHIHNEFLDVLLDGGPVALALFLVLIGLLVYRVSRIGEPAVRLAYQALGVAVLVHLLTDNVYGTEVGQSWCGVVIGMMLAAPLAGPGPRTLGLFSSIRWLAWPFALMSLWGVGNSMVIYLSGLQNVPQELYEAAEIDGANAWRRLWHVTIPLMSPVLYFNLIMGIIGTLQTFTTVFVMTGTADGNPARSTLLYALYLFSTAFYDLRMGYASAMAWMLFVLIVGLTLLATKLTEKRIHYAG